MAWQVREAKEARRIIDKAPHAVVAKYNVWLGIVREHGPSVLNSRFPGFHDKALKGALAGLRESRLSDRYRILYEVLGQFLIVDVVEITPDHTFRTKKR